MVYLSHLLQECKKNCEYVEFQWKNLCNVREVAIHLDKYVGSLRICLCGDVKTSWPNLCCHGSAEDDCVYSVPGIQIAIVHLKIETKKKRKLCKMLVCFLYQMDCGRSTEKRMSTYEFKPNVFVNSGFHL